MLLIFLRSRNASQQLPSREARELFFASGGTPGPSAPIPDKTSPDPARASPSLPNDPAGKVRDAAEQINKQVNETVEGANTPEAQHVDSSRDETKKNAEEILREENKEKEKQATETARLLADLNRFNTTLIVLISDIESIAQAYGVKEIDGVSIQESLNTLHQYSGYVGELQDFLTMLNRFEIGLIPPTEFMQWLNTTAGEKLQRAGIKPDAQNGWPNVREAEALIEGTKGNKVTGLADQNLPDISAPALWRTLNESQKQMAVQKISETLNLKTLRSYASMFLEDMKQKTGKSIDLMKERKSKFTQDLQAMPKASSTGEASEGMWSEFKNALGIEFHSLGEIFEAMGDVKSAFDEWRKGHKQLKRSDLAAGMGRILGMIPGLQEVETDLAIQKSKKVDDRKNSYISILKSKDNQPGFRRLFDPGEYWDQHSDDPIWCMAILEYASEKGFLYDIDLYSQTHTLLGRINIESHLPKDWNENQRGTYISDLWYANRGGREKQIKAGYDINFTNPANAIEQIAGALDGRDLHYSLGLAQKAFEKGKESYVAGWIATTFLRAFEKDPLLRSFLTEEYTELLAKYAGGYTIAFSAGSFYFERGQVLRWAASGNTEPENIREMGRFGNMVADVRADIIKKDPSMDPSKYPEKQAEFDKIVGYVISCNIVKLPNGKFVSIFSKKYDPYNRGSGSQQIIDMSKIDEVYFKEPSEVLMSDQNIIAQQLLRTVSPKGFADAERAFMFIKNVTLQKKTLLKYAEEARKNGDFENEQELEEAANHFSKVMSGKLWEWLRGELKVPGNKVLAEARHKGQEEDPPLATLVVEGIIPEKLIIESPGDWGHLLMAEVEKIRGGDPNKWLKSGKTK